VPTVRATVSALLCFGSTAVAQPAPVTPSATPASTSRVDEARRLIAEGVRCFRANDYAGAVRAFSSANAAVPSPDLWYNIARAREMAQEYAGAVEDYRRYLRDKIDAPDRAEVERRIADLERLAEIQRAARLRRDQRATLRFFVEGVGAEGARFTMDGAPVARGAALSPQEVPVGEHRVEVRAPGALEWVARVRVREGEAMGVYARLAAATRYETRPMPHIASGVLGGLSLVALGRGGLLRRARRVGGVRPLRQPARPRASERRCARRGRGAEPRRRGGVLHRARRGPHDACSRRGAASAQRRPVGPLGLEYGLKREGRGGVFAAGHHIVGYGAYQSTEGVFDAKLQRVQVIAAFEEEPHAAAAGCRATSRSRDAIHA
jgi:hypothetical protein